MAAFILPGTLACFPGAAFTFPPYRSTDAETAGRDAIELRLGLVQLEKEGSETEPLAPLSRLNFGFGNHFEISSEFDYSPDDHRLDEGALGFKWASTPDALSVGVEMLALLPVQSNQGGAGVESQFLTTLRRKRWQLHSNVGFFYDPRSDETEKGLRASVLAEFPLQRVRPGVELFAKKGHGESTRVQAGFGVIAEFERVELRTGLHVGLNDAAPDLEASVWLSWKWEREGDR